MKEFIFPIVMFIVVIAIVSIATFTTFTLNNSQFDRLKWVCLKWAMFMTFCGVVIKVCGIPYGVETMTIVGAFGTLLAGLLDSSDRAYNTEVDPINDEEEMPCDTEAD